MAKLSAVDRGYQVASTCTAANEIAGFDDDEEEGEEGEAEEDEEGERSVLIVIS